MGLLDGGLAPVVGAAFGWLLLPGRLYRRNLEEQDNGKGGFTEDGFAPAEVIKAMVDKASEIMRSADDFNENDVSVMILAFNSETGAAVAKPLLDDEVSIDAGPHAGRYHLMSPIDTDAAGTHYVARGRKL